MKIDSSNFHMWKKDPVTIKLFEALQEVRDSIEMAMIDSNTILEKDSRNSLSRLVGIREGLDIVLQMQADDLIEGEEDEEVNPFTT